MGKQVKIYDQLNTGAVGTSWTLDWQAGESTTLRTLIAERVRAEWARQTDGAGRQKHVQLVASEESGAASLDRTIQRAYESYETGAFLVIVDDRQATALDTKLDLAATSEITFIRLKGD